jgi:hypothetical protein
MALTEQEQQLIQCIRELEDHGEFGITVRREGGAWEIGMSSGKIKSRGVGSTFGDAWDNINGLKFG